MGKALVTLELLAGERARLTTIRNAGDWGSLLRKLPQSRVVHQLTLCGRRTGTCKKLIAASKCLTTTSNHDSGKLFGASGTKGYVVGSTGGQHRPVF